MGGGGFDGDAASCSTSFPTTTMSRPFVRLVRLSDNGEQTEGILEVYRSRTDRSPVARFPMLELPWRGNQRSVSCIPTGSYTLEHRTSPARGAHLWVRGVEPARQLVLIHPGNLPEDTKGCPLPGLTFADLDRDGDLDVAQSKAAMKSLLGYIPDVKGSDADFVVVNAFKN